MKLNSFLKLTPSYRDYVWGGERLRPGHYPTAEAWIVWEGDVIESGPLAGKRLGEAAEQFGDGLGIVRRHTVGHGAQGDVCSHRIVQNR